jgi:hypothetical protein
MATNLVQLSEQLKNLPDQWLAQEMQNPSGAVPPYLILGELQRRKLMRSGAATRPPAASVAQDTVADTLRQIAPPQNQGPPPPPGMTPAARNPPMPGAQPPQNMPKPMADGGLFGDDDDNDEYGTGGQGEADRSIDDDLINKTAARHNVDPKLVRTVIQMESSGDPNAVSDAGAQGAMQLMPGTQKQYGVTDPFDSEQNINAGTMYLRDLQNQFGNDPASILAGYHAGPGAVGKPLGPKTQAYVDKGIQLLNAQPDKQYGPSTELSGASTADTYPFADQAFFGGEGGLPTAGGPLAPPPKAPPWAPPEPETLTAAKGETQAAAENMADVLRRRPTYEEGKYSSPEAFERRKKMLETLIPAGNYSTLEKTVQDSLAEAKKDLHPQIWQVLLQLGMGMLSSNSPYFGTMVGQGGMKMLDAMERRRAIARENYLNAVKLGYEVQNKKDTYNEKIGELNLAQQKAEQAADLTQYKEWNDERKDAKTRVRQAYQAQVKAQDEFRKATDYTREENARATEIITQTPGVVRDPTISPGKQVERDIPTRVGEITTAVQPKQQTPPLSQDALNYTMDLLQKDQKYWQMVPPGNRQQVLDEAAKRKITIPILDAGVRSLGASGLTEDDFRREGEEWQRTGAMAAGRDAATRNRIMHFGNEWARANGYSPLDIVKMRAAYGGDKKSLGEFKTKRDQIVSFEGTAQKNLNLMLETGQKLLDTGSPWLNTPLRDINRNLLGSNEQAAFDAANLVANNEVAKVTSGGGLGGVVSDNARHEMDKATGKGPTIGNMLAVAKILKQDMANRHTSMDETLADIQNRVGTMPGPPPPPPGTTGGVDTIRIGNKKYKYKGAGPKKDIKNWTEIP